MGTDVPLDLAYLDQVAEIVEQLQAPTYIEHLEDSLSWIEELFRRGLVGLCDGNQKRTMVQTNRKSANR